MRFLVPVVALVVVTLLVWGFLPRLRALALLVRIAKQDGVLARLARDVGGAVKEEAVFALPTRHGPVQSRLYRPEKSVQRTAVLIPGVHMDGIREARLVGLARELAAAGLQVLTVAPPDLQRYRITTDSTDVLEDALAWASGNPVLAPDGRVGIMGISFSGGLALVAAGRPRVRDHVAYVLSFGGHADLARVLRYLCQGTVDGVPTREEAGRLVEGGENILIPKPHDYGGVVALLNLADRAVPADQAVPLEQAITTFLQASSIDRFEPGKAKDVFAHARQLGQAMPEPSRTLMSYVSDREVLRLGAVLTPLLAKLALSSDLSPVRSAPPTAPVFLLHGVEDSVIPASEILLLTRELRKSTRVRALASSLITHAEANRGAALAEFWRLSDFWRELLAL